MEEALTSHLVAAGALAALVSQRITWGTRPQSAGLPAVVLHRIDGLHDYHMGGPSGLVSSRIQVDCWAASYGAAKLVSREVIAVLSGLDIRVGDSGSPETFTRIKGGFVDSERDSFEQGAGAEELYRVSLDFIIWHGQG